MDDPCVGVECHNGGTCEIGPSGSDFSCKCPENYADELCDSKEKFDQRILFLNCYFENKSTPEMFL